MRVRLVVLDMAGTTVQDDGLVLRCFVESARAVHLAATEDELNERMGMSKLEVFDELARRQLGDTPAARRLRDDGYDAFRRILEAAYRLGGARPVRGAEPALAWLRERNIRIALNTGFYRAVTDQIIAALGWRDAIDASICVDDVPCGRPAPFMVFEAMQRCVIHSVHDVVVVGDTPSDMHAGHNAGAGAVVGVASGAHGAASLRRAPHTHLIDGVWELPALVRRLERLTL